MNGFLGAGLLIALQSTVVCIVLAVDPNPSPLWVLVPVLGGGLGIVCLAVEVRRRRY